MARKEPRSLFRRLTALFRSGPVVKRKIRGIDTALAIADKTKSSGTLLFQKSLSPTYSSITANAYNLSERLMRYQDFCFGRETLVYTLNGVFTIEELAEKYKNGERFHVYSYDYELKRPVIGTAFFPRVANEGSASARVRVTLDDDGYVDLTPDHKLLLRDGSTREAGLLKPGDSLMPLYVSDVNGFGYNWVYMLGRDSRHKSGWLQEHVLVAEHFYGDVPPEHHVHHKDFNRKNNHPSNLVVMHMHDHQKYHAQLNNVNKLGKPNQAHSAWMRQRGLNTRHDVTFKSIVEACLTLDVLSANAVQDLLGADANVIKLRLKNAGFKNWNDFVARFSDAQALVTHDVIVSESRTPSYEEIITIAPSCASLDELASKLKCSRNAVNRRLQSHGIVGGWTQLSTGASYAGKKRGPAYSGPSYQTICSSYECGMTQDELAQACGTTKNKVGTCLKTQGFFSYADWTKTHKNHKVASVSAVDDDVVYTITVEKHHNLAVGSRSVKQPDKRLYSLIFATQCEMEYTPEIASALDIYADECWASDDKGRALHIHSDNEKIKEVLEDLFYSTLNIEFAGRGWVRNVVKYGDLFLYNDVSPEHGVVNAFPIPVNEIEREENYDREDPFAVRFRWVTMGNRTLENWEVTHFRLLGNDMFLPYGSSVIEPARRIWRQLILIEDAMLVYRVVRAPERRVFYIDVANVPPENVPMYVEEQRRNLRTNQVVDNTSGRVDLRYNPLCFQQLTLIPLLDGRTITIKQLAEEWDAGKRDQEVYSLDLEKGGRVVPGKIAWVGKSGQTTKLARVTLDDGGVIEVTPDHKMMLRDGNPIKAQDLKVGDSLMPMYLSYSACSGNEKDLPDKDCYEKILDPATGIKFFTHRLMAAHKYDLAVYKNGLIGQQGKTVHHVNFDKLDNCTKNLELMSNADHAAYHAALGKEHIIAYNKSEKKKQRVSQRNIERNSVAPMQWYNGSELHAKHNENRRKGQKKSWNVDREKRSKAMRYVWTDQCQQLVIDQIRKLSTFEGLDAFLRRLTTNQEFLGVYTNVNKHLARDPIKSLHKNVVGKFITEQYADWKSVWVAHHPIALGRRFVNNVDMSKAAAEGPNNHKVVSVDLVDVVNEDVFNVTIAEHHNLAVGGKNAVRGKQATSSVVGFIYSFQSVDEDYFIPVRGSDTGTRIDTLAGGQNTAAVEDVAYIQKKLFAALKIPRAYLGYDELLSCLDPSTCVPLLDGRTLTIEQMAQEHDAGKQNWVYSYDKETGNIVPGRVIQAGPTRPNAELVRVTLDNGESFDCTPDHKWMLRNGEWCVAGELKAGDSLMPLYTKREKLHGGCEYEKVYDPGSGRWSWTHKIVHDRVDPVYRKIDGSIASEDRHVIHHVDFDRFNNDPSNLLQMGWESHRDYHASCLAVIKDKTRQAGGYNGLNNGWAKKCRQNVEHLWNLNSLVEYCMQHKPENKRAIINGYGLSETQLHRLLTENGTTYEELANKCMGGYRLARKGVGGYKTSTYRRDGSFAAWCKDNNLSATISVGCRNCNKTFNTSRRKPAKFCSNVCYTTHGRGVRQGNGKNHTVISVVALPDRKQTWCISVEKYENFALAKGSIISNSKATLAQEDIRFSRTINVIQRTMLAELNKLAIIHLYANGFDGEDLQNFTLRLSNPSTVAQQQKLELWRAKFEIGGSLPENMGSAEFVQREIWGLSKEEIEKINEQRVREKLLNVQIEASSPEGEGGAGGASASDLFGGGGEGGEEAPAEEETPPEENAGEEPEEEQKPDVELLTSSDDQEDGEDFALKLSRLDDGDRPVKPQSQLKKALYNRSRHRTHGASKTHMPDFVKMTGVDNDAMQDPTDSEWMKSVVSNPLGESRRVSTSPFGGLSPDMWSTLRRMSAVMGIVPSVNGDRSLIAESDGADVQDELDARSSVNGLNEVLIMDDEDDDGSDE